MKNSPLIMDLIGVLQIQIEHDLTLFEAGDREGFIFLKYVKDVGMVVPLLWIDDYPELEDRWYKFMDGQAYCFAGYYVTDVSKFLRAIKRDNEP